jgi:hypothetical protein
MGFAQDLSDIDPAMVDAVIKQVDPATIDALIQQVQRIEACLVKIDQSEVARLRTEADVKATEIRALCAQGERAAAQSQAIAYGKLLLEEPVVIEAKACLGVSGLAIPQTTWAQLEDSETAQTHVCDL